MEKRNGFTVVELLVTMGVIGLIVSLILPAVQSARSAARRAACANNLRQMALALQNYQSDWVAFPPAPMGYLLPSWREGTSSYGSLYSVHVALLDGLEQAPLHNAINFSWPMSYLSSQGFQGANRTAAQRVVSVFLCPADWGGALPSEYGPNNYRSNAGICGYCKDGADGGAFTWRGTRPADFTDGLSSTLAFSEKLIGGVSPDQYIANRDWIIEHPSLPRPPLSMSADDWVDYCAHRTFPRDRVAVRFDAGRSWMLGTTIFTTFLVDVPPNSPVPDCGSPGAGGQGVFAARGPHPGGVNAAMADGSVRFFTNGTNVKVWRALGTRQGGETLSDY